MQPCRLPRRCHLPGQRCQAGGAGGLWGRGWEHPQNGVLRAACHAVGLPVGFWGGGRDPTGRKEALEPGRSPAFLYGVVGTRHHLGTGWAARAVTPPGCVPLRASLPPIAQRGVCVGPTETRVEVLAVGLGRGWHGSAAPEGLLGTTCGQEGDNPCPFCPLPFPPMQGGVQDLFWVLGGGSCPPRGQQRGPRGCRGRSGAGASGAAAQTSLCSHGDTKGSSPAGPGGGGQQPGLGRGHSAGGGHSTSPPNLRGCRASDGCVHGRAPARGAHTFGGALRPAGDPPMPSPCPAQGSGGAQPPPPGLGCPRSQHGAGVAPAASCPRDGGGRILPPPQAVPGCQWKPLGFPRRWDEPLAVAWETTALLRRRCPPKIKKFGCCTEGRDPPVTPRAPRRPRLGFHQPRRPDLRRVLQRAPQPGPPHLHRQAPAPQPLARHPAPDGAHLGQQRGQLHLGALAAGSGPGAERAPQGQPTGQSAPHQVGVHPRQVPDAGLRPQAALPGRRRRHRQGPQQAIALQRADGQPGDLPAPALAGGSGQLLPPGEGHHTAARGGQGRADPAGRAAGGLRRRPRGARRERPDPHRLRQAGGPARAGGAAGGVPVRADRPAGLLPLRQEAGLDLSELAKAAKKKLQALSNRLFEELAMDVYDEVDRRENDAVWLTTQNHSTLVTERSAVPFLPVNPEYSATRNQGRQKLARFNAREFATLLIDILGEAKRRQQGKSLLSPTGDLDFSLRSQSDLDDQHDYDSVASDEDTDQELLRNASRNNRARSMDSSDLSDGPITLQEYLEVKKALAASEAKVQQLMKVNNSLSDELRRLQREIHKLQSENTQIRQQTGPPHPAPTPSERPEHGHPPGTAPPHRRDRQAFSMYEPGSALKPFGQPVEELVTRLQPFGSSMRKGPSASSMPFPPSSPLLSCPPDGARHMSKLDRHGSGTDSDYDNTQAGEILLGMEGKRFVELSKDEDFPHELDPLDGELDPGLPSTEDVILKTEQVTKNIQELLRAAQESKHDSFVPCSEKIHSAVTEMASLFPKKPALETVRSSLRLLNASAYRLQSECRKTVPPEPGAAVDYQLLTQQVIQCAYDIAKAAKQLVTITTREKKQ
uniref:GIT ArfGAP 1 n=1 Tax=Anas zonorhyncha TaxID=75864 RepID=A0A8B9ZM76_9AVES